MSYFADVYVNRYSERFWFVHLFQMITISGVGEMGAMMMPMTGVITERIMGFYREWAASDESRWVRAIPEVYWCSFSCHLFSSS